MCTFTEHTDLTDERHENFTVPQPTWASMKESKTRAYVYKPMCKNLKLSDGKRYNIDACGRQK